MLTASRVELPQWDDPELAQWTRAIVEAVRNAQRPVVCVAHALGVAALAHAAPALSPAKVKGALLVTPPSEEALLGMAEIDRAFAPFPRDPLPFPSLLVASRSNPYADFETSEDIALAWGSKLTDAGLAGAIDDQSGHGPWPEGLMSFAAFLRKL